MDVVDLGVHAYVYAEVARVRVHCVRLCVSEDEPEYTTPQWTRFGAQAVDDFELVDTHRAVPRACDHSNAASPTAQPRR